MFDLSRALRTVLRGACAVFLILGASSAAHAERYAYLLLTNDEGEDLLYYVFPLECYEGERHMADGSWANTGLAYWDIIPAGETVRIRVWRVQSSHCDGEQSEFSVGVAHRYTALNAHGVVYRTRDDQSLDVRNQVHGEGDHAWSRGDHVIDGRLHSTYIWTSYTQATCGARMFSMDNSGGYDRSRNICQDDMNHLGEEMGGRACRAGSALEYGREEPVESVRWRIDSCEVVRHR
jgi:hypothetical protein